jgi:hypothetical protein
MSRTISTEVLIGIHQVLETHKLELLPTFNKLFSVANHGPPQRNFRRVISEENSRTPHRFFTAHEMFRTQRFENLSSRSPYNTNGTFLQLSVDIVSSSLMP